MDFRKSVDGLAMIVADALEANPGNGDIYVFYNKARNKVKMIHYDGTGFILCYKRLDKGKLKMSTTPHDTHMKLDDQQLCWLLSGLDFMALKRWKSVINITNEAIYINTLKTDGGNNEAIEVTADIAPCIAMFYQQN